MFRRSALVVPVFVLACAARPTEAGDTDSGTTSTGPDPTTMTTAPLPGSTSDTGRVDTTAADSGSDTVSFIAMPTDDNMTAGALPDGSECGSDEDCASMFCFDIFGSGVCSACGSDDDCDEGGCAFDFQTGYAVCNDGTLGDGCESDDACNGGLVCGAPISEDLPFNACGECNDDNPCDGATICSPVLDGGLGASYLGCLEPGSVDNGGTCPVTAPAWVTVRFA